MMQVVVDTDVVSFLFKNHPIGLRYDPELAGRVPSISFMTAAEMERWAIQYRWGEHRLHWLHLYLKRLTWCLPARTCAASGLGGSGPAGKSIVCTGCTYIKSGYRGAFQPGPVPQVG